MKGYNTGKVLYIFDSIAAEITYVAEGTEVIYVDSQLVDAFKEANEDYADLIKPYNFNVITASPKVWVRHTDDDLEAPVDPEPGPQGNQGTQGTQGDQGTQGE